MQAIAAEHSLREAGEETPALMLAAVKQHLASILQVCVNYSLRPPEPNPVRAATNM
jgi:hypothetical protein